MIPGKPGGNSGKGDWHVKQLGKTAINLIIYCMLAPLGGNGGMGGNAGHSGSINVMVREDDMDLLSLISSVNNGAAKLGEKGDFGLGGTPGKGKTSCKRK